MNKFFKRFAAGTIAVMMLSAGAVFADEQEDLNSAAGMDEPTPISSAELETTDDNQEDFVSVVNAPIEPFTAEFETINGVKMLPLRSISEHFGYEVEWNDEARSVSLTKGAQYITLAIDTDAYAFSRMAPMPLGAAPVLFNDETTYVPVNFYSELLGLFCHEDENQITVAEGRIVELLEISEDGALTVKDDYYEEVILNIGENTEFVANGEAVSADLLAVGQLLKVEFPKFMTFSLPPQTTPVIVEILNLPVEVDTEVE